MTQTHDAGASGGAGRASGRATLLERADSLELMTRVLAGVRDSRDGQVVLVAGEAGIGKTTLVGEFCAQLGSMRVLRGACDPLLTPRPLGPLVDIADQTGGELAQLVEGGATASDLLSALASELRRRSPSVVVLEDLHWADEATLDLVRLVARRIEALPALVLATYRDDELDRAHPLRVVLGELPRANVTRLQLKPLSVEAVASLARPHGIDAAQLHMKTGGNPFFVTETLAADGRVLSDSVRDAVLARVARLDEQSRALLDTVSIVPRSAELWLLEELAGEHLAHLERCMASGMLVNEDGDVAFRHEIARTTVEAALPPDRARTLHRAALSALGAPPTGAPDLARLAHHAEAAGDAGAVLAYAPAAGERAATFGAHREAAAQFARALRFADDLPSAQRADLLERRSYESYLTGGFKEATAARREALTEHRRNSNRLREGDSHRWLSRLAWFAGDNATAEAEAREAIRLLKALPAGKEAAMAYSNMSQLRMLAGDVSGAREWGAQAIDLAERLEETEILVHALTNVGTAELEARESESEGAQKLGQALEMALAAGLEEHVARARTNLVCRAIETRDYAAAEHHITAGVAYCSDHDLDSWRIYMTGWQARLHLEQGRWDQAGESAGAVLDNPRAAAPSRITPLVALGLLRARRGDPDAWAPLDKAARLAREIGEAQRILPVGIARAEARWLAGEPDAIRAETDHALALAIAHKRVWETGELLVWRRRAGIEESPPEVEIAEPLRLELEVSPLAACEAWARLGCRYEAALARAHGDDEQALRDSLAELERLGARRAAARVARLLRERGVRNLPHGPRASTRDNPAGLTRRQLEVLALVADGMRNAQIAERLVVSPKTVDHHVSAILGKLGAGTRTEAVAEARRLGIVEK